MTEPTLILSTLYIVLSLAFLMIVCSFNITEYILIYKGLDEKSDKYVIIDNIANNFGTIHYSFMFGTFFFDMYKWMIFIISSENLEKSFYESEHGKSKDAVKIERRTRFLNIFSDSLTDSPQTKFHHNNHWLHLSDLPYRIGEKRLIKLMDANKILICPGSCRMPSSDLSNKLLYSQVPPQKILSKLL